GSEWFLLEGSIKWEYQEGVGSLRTQQVDRQEIWYMFKSYVVPEREFPKAWLWARKQTWMGRWMPEAQHNFRVWLHEHYWPPHFAGSVEGDWIPKYVGDRVKPPCPSPLLVTDHEYLCEKGTYDCSVDETVSVT